MIENSKKCHWEDFLVSVDEKSVWTAHHYHSGDPTDGRKACIPSLKTIHMEVATSMTQLAVTNKDKADLLWVIFFPELTAGGPSQPPPEYPTPKFKYILIMNEQIYYAISKLGPYKVPGPDMIQNVVLIQCTDLIIPHLGPLYRATFILGVYLDCWRESLTVLRKTAKPDYTVLGVHHPITLLNTIPKVLVACVATDLVQLSEIHALLLSNHFGCCPGRTTLDSLHFMVKSIKDPFCKKKS